VGDERLFLKWLRRRRQRRKGQPGALNERPQELQVLSSPAFISLGASSAAWSNASNWSEGKIPQAGDSSCKIAQPLGE